MSNVGKIVRISLAALFLGIALVSCDSGSATSVAAGSAGADAQAAQQETPKIPPIEGYLSCRPSAVDGQGFASLTPSEPVPVGSVGNFEVTYTVGEAGIEPWGYVFFQISPWWEWSEPQVHAPGRAGYTDVETSFDDPDLRIYALTLNRVIVFSETRRMEPGDRIIFRYGPARVDRYSESEELFQIFVDGDGDGHYACIENPPVLKILPEFPAEISVHCPSRAAPGVEVTIRATPLDALGNWTRFQSGTYDLKVDNGEGSVEAGALEAEGDEKTLDFTYAPPEEGIYFFHVEGPGLVKGKSNVLFCEEGTPTKNLYFGDIHGHTRISDGTGTPEDYYDFARDVSGLDIAAVTDHVDYGTIPVKGAVWERIKKATSDAYVPGRFVTFLGFEWTNWVYGHRNVYYLEADGPVFRSFEEASDTPQELWKLLEPYEAMTIAHHVGGGPVPIDWSIPPHPMERLVEICSVHGSSEWFSRSRECIYHPVEGHFVLDALAKGYRLGILASGDTHDGHPGKRSIGAVVNGIFGIYAPELTREAIWEALKRRQVYGTSGPKILLFFRVANSAMGSEVTWPAENGPIPIALQTVGCDEIEIVEIVRNGKIALRHEPEGGCFVQFLVEDSEPSKGTNWYYARIVQKDGNLAWSSPVWVTVE